MHYWWINHNKSFEQEKSNGFLWSPQKNKNEKELFSYDNMEKVKEGDFAVSYAKRKIQALGIVTGSAISQKHPEMEDSVNGWLVKVKWINLTAKPDLLLLLHGRKKIADYLQKRYSIFNAEGQAA